MTIIGKFMGAAAALVLAAGAAAASPAVVSTDLNVRAGQGTQYPPIAVMPAGSVVDVTGCSNGWCYVRDYGGFASARYLNFGTAAYAAAPPARIYVAPRSRIYADPLYRPGVSFGIEFGSRDRYRPGLWGW
jgi:uncharacterized protein YraI